MNDIIHQSEAIAERGEITSGTMVPRLGHQVSRPNRRPNGKSQPIQ